MTPFKSPRTIKLVLPAMWLILTAVALFAFKSKMSNQPEKALFSTLTFKYQPSTYTEPQVESNGNWNLIDPGGACPQEANDAACSFSIDVPTGNESLYLNGTQPSSRVLIEAGQNGTTSNHYVSQLKENISGTPTLPGSISNIEP